MRRTFHWDIVIILSIILAVVPVILWLVSTPVGIRFSTTENVWHSIGQLCGLIGMSLLAGNIILAVRLKFLDRWYAGLNFVYRDHHWIGTLAFCFLMVHPLALAARFATRSLVTAAYFLIPNWNINRTVVSGVTALSIMMVLLLLTYFFRPSYKYWLWSHKFLALAFAIGFLHMIKAESDVTRFAPLSWYYYTLSILAFIAIIYRVIFARWLVKRFSYKIISINRPDDKIFDFLLEPVGKPMPATAGQFAFFIFVSKNLEREAHPFSIAGMDNSGRLRVVIKNLGDHTENYKHLAVGDGVVIEGPFGSFGQEVNGPALWIAGGVGVTPFLSMAQSLPVNADVCFVHAVGKKSEAIFNSELEQVCQKVSLFKPVFWISDEVGRLTAQNIDKIFPDWRERTILICGPVPMMESLTKQFIALGGDKKKIINENFSL